MIIMFVGKATEEVRLSIKHHFQHQQLCFHLPRIKYIKSLENEYILLLKTIACKILDRTKCPGCGCLDTKYHRKQFTIGEIAASTSRR